MSRDIEPFYGFLGRRIALLRLRARLTQEELGARLSPPVTRASIANIEAGKQRVYVHTLAQLAAALGVPVPDLFPESVGPGDSSRSLARELQEKVALSEAELHDLIESVTKG